MTLVAPTALKIKIYRVTTTKPLVGWADASVLKAADMTVQSTQLLHLAEETSDLAQDGGLSKDGTDNIWDARYNKIKNLLDPTEPGDAVTLSYITKNQNSLLTQLRNTGDTQNTRLVTTGNSYVSTMTTLRDAITTKATEANNSAALAQKWAEAEDSPNEEYGSKSSLGWAREAKASANKAAASASAAQSSADSSASYVATASSSANAAKQSALSSANNASAAASSASNAKTSETKAASSAAAAAKSAIDAAKFDPSRYYLKSEVDNKIRVIWDEPLEWDKLDDQDAIREGRLIVYDMDGNPLLLEYDFLQYMINNDLDLSAYALKTAIPTKTSQLTNDSGFAVISNGHLVINGSELWIG